MNDLSDEQLLKRYLQSGDQNAFGLLVTRHINAIYAAARRQVRDAELAQDVTQAVFIILARRAGAIRERSCLPGWLLKVTWFASRDALRSQARRRRNERQVDAMIQTRIHPKSAEQAQAWREIAPVLDDALTRLNDADRTAIMLRFLEDKSIEEVAQFLGTTEAAATKRISRALPKLRRHLVRCGVAVPMAVLGVALANSAAEAAPAESAALALKAALLGSKMSIAAGGSAGSASLVKGTLMTMTLAKLKSAAIAAAILLVAFPAGVVVVRHLESPMAQAQTALPQASPAKAADTPAATAPAALYALAEGQLVKRIIDPPENIRFEFWKSFFNLTSTFSGTGKAKPTAPPPAIAVQPLPAAMIAALNQSGTPVFWTYDPDNAYMLSAVFEEILNVYPQEMEGDDFTFPGDFLFAYAATPEERRAALEKIIREELREPLILNFREAQRKVIVFKGQWKYTAPDSKRAKSKDMNYLPVKDMNSLPVLEFYDAAIKEGPQSIAVGDAPRLAGHLGKALGEQVVFDVQGLPAGFVWVMNDANAGHFADHTNVLNHITEQTGLKWTEETRTVRRLFVEEKK